MLVTVHIIPGSQANAGGTPHSEIDRSHADFRQAITSGNRVPAPSAEETAKKAAQAAKVKKYRAQYNLPAEMSSEDVLDHVTNCLTKKSRAKKDTTKKTPQQFPDGHKLPLLAALKEHCWHKSTFCQTEEDVKILGAKVCKKAGYAQWESQL